MICKKTLISLLIVLSLAHCQTLPGLDYLKSGYDATKILNDQLGQSKYSIFDFTQVEGQQDFYVNGNAYKIPFVVNAASNSVRKESQAEQVYTSYDKLLRKYSESISFSVGVNWNNIAVDLSFNHQLDELHRKMTQEGKAMHISQSYWAMYSITTAPAFLMPLNPMFKQTLEALNSMAKNPSTESQQTIYNQVVSSFGTHYVSSVIMGGNAKMFTSFNKQYIETTDTRQVKNDINLNFKYLVANFTFGRSTADSMEHPTSQFTDNSATEMTFSPEAIHLDSEKPWAAWETQVPINPQPVNTTVSYITDLAFQYPEVQYHLRKTIDFYLRNARLPSLAEVQNFQLASPQKLNTNHNTQKSSKTMQMLSSSIFEEALQELCPFPGYYGTYCPAQQNPSFAAYKRQLQQSVPHMPSGIGASFDITTGQLKLPAIQLTYQDNGQQIWTDPTSNRQFVVADETNIEQVDVQPDVKIFRNEFELANIWLEATQRGQWLGGEYSSSKDLNDVFEKYFKGEQETSIQQLARNVVRLTFKSDNLKLNRFAQRAVDSLPQEFVPEVYNDFLESWGTHVAVDTYLGGMIEKQIVYKDCVYATTSFTGGLSADQVVQALNNELYGNQGDGFFAARRRVTIDHKFGGNPEDVPNWESTISQNPALLKINRFMSWDNFVGDGQIKVNLQQAIQNRVNQMIERQNSYRAYIQEQRRIQRSGPRLAYTVSGWGNGYLAKQQNIAVQGAFYINDSSQCPPGLDFDTSKVRCSSGEMVSFDGLINNVRYERDDYGNYRTVALDMFRGDNELVNIYGAWVDRGCSVANLIGASQYSDFNSPPPNKSAFKMVCTDCVPSVYNSPYGVVLQCSCPAF